MVSSRTTTPKETKQSIINVNCRPSPNLETIPRAVLRSNCQYSTGGVFRGSLPLPLLYKFISTQQINNHISSRSVGWPLPCRGRKMNKSWERRELNPLLICGITPALPIVQVFSPITAVLLSMGGLSVCSLLTNPRLHASLRLGSLVSWRFLYFVVVGRDGIEPSKTNYQLTY